MCIYIIMYLILHKIGAARQPRPKKEETVPKTGFPQRDRKMWKTCFTFLRRKTQKRLDRMENAILYYYSAGIGGPLCANASLSLHERGRNKGKGPRRGTSFRRTTA